MTGRYGSFNFVLTGWAGSRTVVFSITWLPRRMLGLAGWQLRPTAPYGLACCAPRASVVCAMATRKYFDCRVVMPAPSASLSTWTGMFGTRTSRATWACCRPSMRCADREAFFTCCDGGGLIIGGVLTEH